MVANIGFLCHNIYMKTDIEIARDAKLNKIAEIADGLGIHDDNVIPYGKYIAKVPYSVIDDAKVKKNNLILVTAITPTKAGIGKTTVSIGLALGLNKIGKKAVAALREPSLGPCFGMKGGAAGGGYAQVLPMEDINLHFTGDFHAITSAHNMISALFDNYIFRAQGTPKAIKTVLWKRVLDVNDRNLRQVVTGLGEGNGVVMESGFDITPASEIMAIFCLAKDIEDLRRRIENIILGYDTENNAVKVKDLGIAGSIVVLLKNAINPNLVQTTENTPAFIHGGPFANIAHGCNSVIATKTALTYGEYVITEAGFAADLGAEKFFDIKCRKAGLNPKLTVIAATTGGLKMHGDVPEKEISKPNAEALKKGLANLDKHIENMKKFGQTVVVALNRYGYDIDSELDLVRKHCEAQGVGFAVNNAFVEGGKGAVELAELVVKTIETNPSKPLKFVYEDKDSIKTKIGKICKEIYGAADVTYSGAADKMIKKIEEAGMADFPVCVAKTQYSFSSDPKLYGVPTGFEMNVRDIVLNSGSEMIVAIMGDMMRMPGLPKDPQAVRIDLVNGNVEGLS
ncbi:formate--tetrahydrofolate ligase [Treponema denticola]|uniref:formate--tetrahydrofolate ligase n=1 Tax=Treponema denticola TaxID=158 RepID=UPI0020A3E59B|nr:formate--tetrahydrofolate ligase [Treponema denticola]